MIALNNNNQLVTLASGQRMWIGTSAAHDAAVLAGTMPNNCTVAIIDEAQATIRPRSTGIINLANDAGALAESLSAATEYTVSEDGMIIAHVVKTAGGNTCMMAINGNMVDLFPYYAPTVCETTGSQTEVTLSAFARKGDKVKVYCDGNGTKYCLAKLSIQQISWTAD